MLAIFYIKLIFNSYHHQQLFFISFQIQFSESHFTASEGSANWFCSKSTASWWKTARKTKGNEDERKSEKYINRKQLNSYYFLSLHHPEPPNLFYVTERGKS
jgi:hypothetical protein